MEHIIDETFSDDIEAHEKATSLRLAFEFEASQVRQNVQHVAQDILRSGVPTQNMKHVEDINGDRQYDHSVEMGFVYFLDDDDDNDQKTIADSEHNQVKSTEKKIESSVPIMKKSKRFVSPMKIDL